MKSKVDFVYEGTEIGGLSGTDLADGELFGTDTLQMLMFPDTVDASFNSPLASRIQVGMSLQLCRRQ